MRQMAEADQRQKIISLLETAQMLANDLDEARHSVGFHAIPISNL